MDGGALLMNWEMVAAVCSVLGILTTVVCVAFVSGKLTQQISDNRKLLEEHDKTLLDHGDRLSDHDVELAKLNEWKNGYNAAAAISGKREQVE